MITSNEKLRAMTTSELLLIESVETCMKQGDFGAVTEVLGDLFAEIRKLSELNIFLLNRGN